MLKCAICGAQVSQDNDGALVRTCDHSEATVIAELVATAYGASHVNDEE